MSSKGNQTCTNSTGIIGYLIFIIALIELVFSYLRIALFFAWFRGYEIISSFFYIPYTMWDCLWHFRIPLVLWIVTQVYFFGISNDCSKGIKLDYYIGWYAMYCLVFAWIIYLYIFVFVAIALFVSLCTESFVIPEESKDSSKEYNALQEQDNVQTK